MPVDLLGGSRCPACESNIVGQAYDRRGDSKLVRCPACGPWLLAGTAEAMWPQRVADDGARTLVCRWIRERRAAGDDPPSLTGYSLEEAVKGELPDGREVRDGFLEWVLARAGAAGQKVQAQAEAVRADVGMRNDRQLVELLEGLQADGLLEWRHSSTQPGFWTKLTQIGQEAAEEVRRARAERTVDTGTAATPVDTYHARMMREAPWHNVENLQPFLERLAGDLEVTSEDLVLLAARVPSEAALGSTWGRRLDNLRASIRSLAESRRHAETQRSTIEQVDQLAEAIAAGRPAPRGLLARALRFIGQHIVTAIAVAVVSSILVAWLFGWLGMAPPG